MRMTAFVLVFLALTANVLLGQATVVVKEQVTITVDKATVRTDVPPINVQGQTLVPVRGVFNAFNADIDWIPCERRVFVRKGTTVIWIGIGDTHAKVNDAILPLAVPAQIYRGRTMVPLRFIAESLGAQVNWDPDTQTITILTKTQQAPSTAPPAATAPSPPPAETPEEPVTPAEPEYP